MDLCTQLNIIVHAEHTTNYPIFCSLSYERALIPTSAGITLDGMSTGSNKVIKLRKFDDKGVPVIFVERSFFKIFLYKRGFEWDVGLFLMRYMSPG
jgi:hypothetical protein